MPFSDNVCYIFDQQLEEAGILVINKADLLTREDGQTVLDLARRRFSARTLLLQTSLTPEGVAPWLAVLQAAPPLPPALVLDYGPYIAGSAELAWFDEQLTFTPHEGQERASVIRLITAVVDSLRQSGHPVAHVKFFIQDTPARVKVSFVTLDEQRWDAVIPYTLGTPVTVLINARVQMDAEALAELVTQALQGALTHVGVTYHTTGATAFAPRVPANPDRSGGDPCRIER